MYTQLKRDILFVQVKVQNVQVKYYVRTVVERYTVCTSKGTECTGKVLCTHSCREIYCSYK